MSITPIESPPSKRQHEGWAHHHSRRPTLYVSERKLILGYLKFFIN